MENFRDITTLSASDILDVFRHGKIAARDGQGRETNPREDALRGVWDAGWVEYAKMSQRYDFTTKNSLYVGEEPDPLMLSMFLSPILLEKPPLVTFLIDMNSSVYPHGNRDREQAYKAITECIEMLYSGPINVVFFAKSFRSITFDTKNLKAWPDLRMDLGRGNSLDALLGLIKSDQADTSLSKRMQKKMKSFLERGKPLTGDFAGTPIILLQRMPSDNFIQDDIPVWANSFYDFYGKAAPSRLLPIFY